MAPLPHFETQVPVAFDDKDMPHVPLYALCALLGIDASDAYHRASKKLARWSMASLLPVRIGTHVYAAWTVPYPAGVGMWCLMIHDLITDKRRRTEATSPS